MLGIFLLSASVYAITAPGRIDIIDGQLRFEVARMLVRDGTPRIVDPFLPALDGVDGRYTHYGALSSLVGVPWVALADAFGGGPGAEMFAFSFAQVGFASLVLAVLYREWRLDGISERASRVSAALVGVGTPWWLYASSCFDQVVQGALLLGVFLAARRAARHDSAGWALAAGLSYAAILQAQEVFVVLIPFALPMLMRDGERPGVFLRSSRPRMFLAAAFLGILGVFFYNHLRFGSPFTSGKEDLGHPVIGNPLVGLAGLLFSPGKSVFLYHPLILLCLVGWWTVRSRFSALSRGTAAFVLAHTLLISWLLFWPGEWAWGPRSLVFTLPLVAFGLPWGIARVGTRATAACASVAFVVQLLSVLVDHQGWYFSLGFEPNFWLDPLAEWRHSALYSRPAEVLALLDGPPLPPVAFAPGPRPDLPTYCIFGFDEPARASEWMKHHAVFWLPRMWPLWFPHVPASLRPVDPRPVLLALVALAAVGGGLLLRDRGADHG